MFYYYVVKLLRIVIHNSKYSKSVQNVVIYNIFSSESLRVVNSLHSSKFTTHIVFSMLGSLGFVSPRLTFWNDSCCLRVSKGFKIGLQDVFHLSGIERRRWGAEGPALSCVCLLVAGAWPLWESICGFEAATFDRDLLISE